MAKGPGALEGLVMHAIQMFNGFFLGKKVLVTGHTGFKGAWLALWLKELGADVTGYSLEPSTQPNLYAQCVLASKIQSHIGDVRDPGMLRDLIAETKPQIVFHLAAQALVRESYRQPVETFSTNVMGTVHLLETIRLAGASVKVCQIITSDKCYHNQGVGYAYCESDPVGGRDPYSASKAAAELVVGAYRDSYFPAHLIAQHGVSVSSVRAGNVVGGGDWAKDRILPDCVRALWQEQPILVRNPHSVRPWQHVLDALAGYLSLAEAQGSMDPAYADAWNFGPLADQELTVKELVEMVIKYWGSGTWASPEGAESAAQKNFYEAAYLKLDVTKAMQKLPWRPVYGVSEALEQTVHWYRRAYEDKNFDAYAYCLSQFRVYAETAKERGCPWANLKQAIPQ